LNKCKLKVLESTKADLSEKVYKQVIEVEKNRTRSRLGVTNERMTGMNGDGCRESASMWRVCRFYREMKKGDGNGVVKSKNWIEEGIGARWRGGVIKGRVKRTGGGEGSKSGSERGGGKVWMSPWTVKQHSAE
jgi:hypothetical protein